MCELTNASCQQKETSQVIFPSTRGHGRTNFTHNPDGRDTTLATGHQDDNKNIYEANILCSLTFKVFQKHTFFRMTHLQPPSPKRPVAKTARRQNGSAGLS